MMSVVCILSLCALISAIVALMGRCPVTVPVLLVAIVQILQGCLPLR